MEKLLEQARHKLAQIYPMPIRPMRREAHLIALMVENPTLIKRPVIEAGAQVSSRLHR